MYHIDILLVLYSPTYQSNLFLTKNDNNMNVQITATANFKNYLKTSYPGITIKESEVVVQGSYNAFFSMKPGDILISIIITYSPMMFNAINDYVTQTNQKIVVTTDEEQYEITPQNIKTIIPMIKNEAIISFNEERNGKKRQF